jgi:hypothetical protein
MILIVEGSDATDTLSILIVCHPTDCFAILKELILLWIEDTLYRAIKWANPIWITLI